MIALQVATLWLALVAPAMPAAARPDRPRAYIVAADEVEVLVEASDSAYATGTLRRGARVTPRAIEAGWAEIEPPPGSFDWADAADLDEEVDGPVRVGQRPARVRHAADGARLPGPPGRTLDPGTTVRLVDHRDLRVGRGPDAQVWRAIAPEDDAVRYVRLDGLRPAPPAGEDPPARRPPPDPRRSAPAERLVAYQPEPAEPVEPAEPDLPAEVNAELASIAATVRSIKATPIEAWDFAPVAARYEALLQRYGDNPRIGAVVQPRLDRANRDRAIGTKAREVARLLRSSEARDAEVAQIRQAADRARSQTERKFDAQGLLQASSRRSNGQKVLALIGPEGKPVSYLTIPPGVPINRYLARKVGVRGVVHFDEGLGARLISVRDLELLDKFR